MIKRWFVYLLAPALATLIADAASIVLQGEATMENHFSHTTESVSFEVCIVSNQWKMTIRVPKSSHNAAFDLVECFDGTNRIRYFPVSTNVGNAMASKEKSFSYSPDYNYQAMVFPNESIREGSIYQNVLWFALCSGELFSKSSSNIVVQSLFPGVMIGDTFFDRTNRYVCSVIELLSGTGLPKRTDFFASEALWKEEGMVQPKTKWPFKDGYRHAAYEVRSTTTFAGVEFPLSFTLKVFWPSDVIGSQKEELYEIRALVQSVREFELALDGALLLTNDKPTLIRDYRHNGPPAAYILKRLQGVPDITDPVVQQAFMNANRDFNRRSVSARQEASQEKLKKVCIVAVLLLCVVIPAVVFCRNYVMKRGLN